MEEPKKKALSFLSIRNKKQGKFSSFEEEDVIEVEEEKSEHSFKSRRSGYKAADNTRLESSVYDGDGEEDFDVFKYIGLIVSRKYWFLGGVAVMVIICLLINSRLPKIYSSTTRLSVKVHPIEDALGNIFYGNFTERAFLASNHLENLKTPDEDFLKHVINLLDTNLTTREIRSIYKVKLEPDSDMLILRVTSSNAKQAKKIADALAKAYEDYDLKFRQKNFMEKEKWIISQLDLHSDKLNTLEVSIKDFKEKYPKFNPKNFNDEIFQLESQLKNLTLTMEEDKQKLDLVSSAFARADSVVVAEVTRDRPLQKELLTLEVELAKLKVNYGEESRQVKETMQQMENIKSLLDQDIETKSYTTILQANPRYQNLQGQLDELRSENKVKSARKKELEKMLEEAYRQSSEQPELQLEYIRLERERSASEKLYNMLKENLEETRLKKSGVNREVYQIGQASAPSLATKGKLNLWAILGLSIAFGIGLCVVVDKLDRSIRFPLEIEKKLGIPVLGIIPELAQGANKITIDSDSKIIEPYRNLRTNINYSSIRKTSDCQTLIITSALQGEGKTTKAVNLAICFSLDGKKVLLVDADMRRSSIHGILNCEKGPGLSEYLTGQNDLDDVMQKTSYPGLFLTSSGERMPNPAEILGSEGLLKFISDAKKHFDVILFDSPAIFPVSDALVLAPLMDAVLVVFRSNYTPMKAGEEVLKKLRRLNAHIVGGVLNDVDAGKGKYYYSYYGYYGYSYYHNYYDENPKNPRENKIGGAVTATKNSIGNFYRKFQAVKKRPEEKSHKNRRASRSKLNVALIVLSLLLLLSGAGLLVIKKLQVPEFIPIQDFKEVEKTVETKKAEIPPIKSNGNYEDSLQIRTQLSNWANGLGQLNLPLYLSNYSVVKFEFKGGGFEDWKVRKQAEFKNIQDIKLKIEQIEIDLDKPQARVKFLQTLNVDGNETQYEKVQYWEKEDKRWGIVREGILSAQQEIGAKELTHEITE